MSTGILSEAFTKSRQAMITRHSPLLASSFVAASPRPQALWTSNKLAPGPEDAPVMITVFLSGWEAKSKSALCLVADLGKPLGLLPSPFEVPSKAPVLCAQATAAPSPALIASKASWPWPTMPSAACACGTEVDVALVARAARAARALCAPKGREKALGSRHDVGRAEQLEMEAPQRQPRHHPYDPLGPVRRLQPRRPWPCWCHSYGSTPWRKGEGLILPHLAQHSTTLGAKTRQNMREMARKALLQAL